MSARWACSKTKHMALYSSIRCENIRWQVTEVLFDTFFYNISRLIHSRNTNLICSNVRYDACCCSHVILLIPQGLSGARLQPLCARSLSLTGSQNVSETPPARADSTFKVTMVPGDGVGPELMTAVKEVFKVLILLNMFVCMVSPYHSCLKSVSIYPQSWCPFYLPSRQQMFLWNLKSFIWARCRTWPVKRNWRRSCPQWRTTESPSRVFYIHK